ncbi:hypothetical protein DTO013E5_8696 [Penicillium roqueforti]|uniref:uncharacterized protein n=1 Tax=Penicillium roqueforti TaxID=5082 RepID=UPI00190D9E9A|nr:uncharacterized protein LCP9604111_3987 [Penicillium roqueforti]KAF9249887.1 hypothetical protein LCP9604111_3987 [Penicillium roqueforti]KAI1830510.1 hypothetical protein CBS147337_8784 [Penicillium roqueforti]KAI2684891.1 hypothetical protein LCP963914a_4983 [Penicillium roqueforti]KAI2697123.1 hypothetical protein CBS147372_7861 [Penicillium roqueforti]KAI2715597.1 hypothetical protein CBS147318_6197 [Penicillium roqueforti]
MPKIKFTILLHHLAINLLPLRHAIIMFPYPAPSVLSIEMTSQHSWFRGPELRSIVFDAGLSSSALTNTSTEKIPTTPLSPMPPSSTSATNTEMLAKSRSQARAWTPPELVAYKTLTDKQSEVTPRLLGYREEEQESSALVPAGFLVSLRGSKCLFGIPPPVIFMVGFRQWFEVKPTPWNEAKPYWFDLAKPPQRVNWSEWINNPDTSY